ncbi:MAG TPA: DNA replication/repair protein RecF, partial [Candidatus Dormibacteraeota bacterium]|nr:DNA replication/repair protein RecF [Candidatus Dormibacteraeota bacterium]
ATRGSVNEDGAAAERGRGQITLLTLNVVGVRGYERLQAAFPPGPQLLWGPNAAGKTSLIEAIVLLSRGASHRASSDSEIVRWGAPFARVEGWVGGTIREGDGGDRAGADSTLIEVSLERSGAGTRKRVRVNGVGRRASALTRHLRTVLFAPEEMLLVAGAPSLRRTALDALAGQRSPAYAADLATYARALAQRNSLLRAIREETAERDQLRYWDGPFLEAGSAIVAERHRLLAELAAPLARAHAEIAPDEAAMGPLEVGYESNAAPQAGESARQALTRRLAETAEKEVWNGSTLVGPHRDDLVFRLGGRDLAAFASRGQQRTAILAFKLAELDLLRELDGRPPLLLLDDVFSELDPERRGHLVRRIAELPQAFVTTTTPADLDPRLLEIATAWEVVPDGGAGARLVGPSRAPGGGPIDPRPGEGPG